MRGIHGVRLDRKIPQGKKVLFPFDLIDEFAKIMVPRTRFDQKRHREILPFIILENWLGLAGFGPGANMVGQLRPMKPLIGMIAGFSAGL